MIKQVKTISGFAATFLALAGCTFSSVQPGMSRQEVIDRYGTPSRVVPLDSGTRLQYSSQPAGQRVVMVDLDAAGMVISARQVMTPKEFSKIVPEKWTRYDVEREFGRPATIDRVASWSGDIMSYRWLDLDQRMFFWVYLDGQGVVRRTGQGMEFRTRSHFMH